MGKHLLRKFFLLMWKNWVLHKRNPWQTAMEILAPVILGMVLVIVRSFAEPKPNPEVYFNPYPPVLNGTYITTVLPLSAISELLLKYSGVKEISTSSSHLSTIVSWCILVLQILPFLYLAEDYANLELHSKLIPSCFSNTAMAFGFIAILAFEGTGTSAPLLAGAFWLLQILPFLYLAENYANLELHSKLIPSCFSNTAMAFGFIAILAFEGTATSAPLLAGAFWLLQILPFMYLAEDYANLELHSKLIPSCFSNTAMAFGFIAILAFEGTGKGAQWDTLFQPAVSGDNVVLGYIWIMLLFDSLIYVLFARYLEAVFPGEYGVPKPRYFPFQPSFWCGILKRASQMDEIKIIRTKPDDVHEVEPNDLKAGIQIIHLRKVYHEKAAVKDLVLNMYEGQITVLLGHNGAGKTTTLSMLMDKQYSI